MATTKAKAKVKPVVKSKAKAAPSKVAPVKKGVAKKAIPAKKITANKVIAKKATPQKAPVKSKAPAKKLTPIKKVVAIKAKPATKVIESKKPIKSAAKVSAKIQIKAKEKAPEKKQKVEQLMTKKSKDVSDLIVEKKKKFEFPKKRAGRKPKNKGDDDDGFELLEVPKLEPISKKAPKKKFIIPVSQEIYVNPLAKQVVAPKNMGTYKKFEIEFPIHASPYIIYSFISSPAGLSEWFAENVNIRNDEYTFFWDGSQQTATLLSKKENTFMKFRWNDEPDFTFFEFRIIVDEITQDVAFWVTDFAEDEKSKEASEMLWHSQIDALIHAMGA